MSKADDLYQRALKVMPGGVTAAARINKALGKPFFVARGEGSKVYDLDGREYVDMCTSFGASLLGHGHPRIKEAVARAAEVGFICSYENEYETELAEKIVATIPSAEMVRFTISGTETTWYAVRIARQITGRKKIVKFEGHFHGYNDYLQFNYWPPLAEAWPNVRQEAYGGPTDLSEHVIVLPFNDAELLAQTLEEQGQDIAAVIMEPLNYNSCGIRPLPGYLATVRELTTKHNVILIFDEILSNFRTGPGCIQAYYGVTPDMCTIGKAMAGGLALSAYAGKAELMRHVTPAGKAMHSGTFNANLVSIMAANAFFDVIGEPAFYEGLLRRSNELYEQMNRIFAACGLCARVQGTGARFNVLFGEAATRELVNYRDAALQDWPTAYRFFKACLDHGVYFHTMQHHGLSGVHSDEDVARVLEAVEKAAAELVAAGPVEASNEAFGF